jgi:hypothetical protein
MTSYVIWYILYSQMDTLLYPTHPVQPMNTILYPTHPVQPMDTLLYPTNPVQPMDTHLYPTHPVQLIRVKLNRDIHFTCILCLLNNTCVQHNFKSVHVSNLF